MAPWMHLTWGWWECPCLLGHRLAEGARAGKQIAVGLCHWQQKLGFPERAAQPHVVLVHEATNGMARPVVAIVSCCNMCTLLGLQRCRREAACWVCSGDPVWQWPGRCAVWPPTICSSVEITSLCSLNSFSEQAPGTEKGITSPCEQQLQRKWGSRRAR